MPAMDYTKLLNRAREFGYSTQKEFASVIGISEGQFCHKLSGNYAFTQTEIKRICELLDIPPAEIGLYFFSEKVEKTQQE